MARYLGDVAYITSILSNVFFEDYKRKKCSPKEVNDPLDTVWDSFFSVAWGSSIQSFTKKGSDKKKEGQLRVRTESHQRLYEILCADALQEKYGVFRQQLNLALQSESPPPTLERGTAKRKKLLILWTQQIRTTQVTNFLLGLRRVRGFCKKQLVHKILESFPEEKKKNPAIRYCSRVLTNQLLGGGEESYSFPGVQTCLSEHGRKAVMKYVCEELKPIVPELKGTERCLKNDKAFSKGNASRIIPFFFQLREKVFSIDNTCQSTVAPIARRVKDGF